MVLYNNYAIHFLDYMVKKLNPLFVQQKLLESNIAIFSPRDFQRIFGASSFAVSKFIGQYAKKKFFLKLRNGLYCLASIKPSSFVIANKIYQPSYISLEAALSFYNIIPEKTYSITSISSKATRSFMAVNQDFSYSKIKKKLFTGYYLTEKSNEKFLIAEPEKALMDYLYYLSRKKTELNDRLDVSRLKKKKIKQWQKLFGEPTVDNLISKLYDESSAN